MYIYLLRKKFEARLGVAYGFGMFQIFGKTRLSNNEQDFIQYDRNYICHLYAVIFAQSRCLSRYAQTRFSWNVQFPGVCYV